MRVSPGSNPTFYVAFTDEQLLPTDPTSVTVDVFNGEGAQVVSNAVPVKDSTGNYHYTVAVAPDAPQGLWRIDWEAMLDGRVALGSEEFDVAAAGMLVNPGDMAFHAPLRSRIGEVSRLAADQNASDTMFAPAEIAEILTLSAHDLDKATLEGWERKAARLSRLIDVAESGTQRTLSQKFDQANKLVEHWRLTVENIRLLRAQALSGRVVGKVVSLREPTSMMFIVGTQPNAYTRAWLPSYDRYFPTHRLIVPYGWN